MPTYVYAVVKPDGSLGDTFEVFQRITEDALTQHPQTGEPIQRVPVLPQVQTMTDKGRFSNSNLERLGFTKYERAGDGVMEKKAGQGPDMISAD
ncbi:MAG: FmdB family transcriptional regulator [Planctomycetota bacterium]|nr:FmdB family transcriptional regulator [Planctomycetota bacterium]MDA1105473.1 FmdB family transcriptional regulator [Planctomycetota bacterium]